MPQPVNFPKAGLPADEDEFAHAGLTVVESTMIDAPRVGEAKAQMECRVTHQLHVGREGGGSWLIVGEVVAFHIDPELLDGTRIDQAKLRAVGRHAGNWYSHAEDLFELIRPA